MSVLQIKNLNHRYGDKVLYQNGFLELNPGEKLGVVGPNGVGKSTLIQIISEEILPDDGLIKWQENIAVGYLDQQAQIDKNLTIYQYLKSVYHELFLLKEKLENNLQKLEAEYSEKILNKIIRDQKILEEKNFEKLAAQVKRVAAGLGLMALGIERKIGELSGGQRAKVILAKLLLEKPEVLLMDEPTNFLDKEHIEWLAKYLQNFSGSLILISHDSEFLNEVCTHIAALEAGEIRKYRGNYAAYIQQRDLQKQVQGKLYEKQQKVIAKTQDYIARNRARASTAKQAQSRQKMLNKMVKIEPTKTGKPPVFSFTLARGAHGNSLVTHELLVGYERPLLPPIDLKINDGEKVVITGFNGVGKSTLLKTLVGEIQPLGGRGSMAANVVINYFQQDLEWEEPRLNPLEIMFEAAPYLTEQDLRKKLAAGAINKDHIRQAISSLSGGEQAKVKLIKMMLKKCNFLILDEPTNHLDMGAKAALKQAILDFAGAVILVSHEEAFYQDWADRVIRVGK